MNKEVRKGVRLTPILAKALAEHADKIDRSESWIINEALKSYLSPKPLKP